MPLRASFPASSADLGAHLSTAKHLLDVFRGLPLRAFWSSLHLKVPLTDGYLVAMAIIFDPRCGLERRASLEEGAMINAAGVELNKSGGGATPLILAAHAGRPDVVKSLLQSGADPGVVEDQYGLTALHACISSSSESIPILIRFGADAKIIDDTSRTPLHYAAWVGDSSAVAALVLLGSDVSAVDDYGCTPLHSAAWGGHYNVLDMLVAAGSNVNAMDRKSRTPLHFASSEGHLTVIEYLISHGAHTLAVDFEGSNPFAHFASNELLMCSMTDLKKHKICSLLTEPTEAPFTSTPESNEASANTVNEIA